jgi:tetratricopeptide (TPR) repeat protein
MRPRDKNYLSQQFQIKIYSKTGIEFQSFFEDILEKAYPDFQKIRPYGKEGDAGNDGYRKDSGIYYQVHAPRIPQVSESAAARKLEGDFYKLKEGWDEISKIKEFNFVFNDKYDGSVQLLEETITDLEAENPGIEFKLFLAKDLEKVFFQLSETDILSLGFDVDQRQAVANAYTYLDIVKTELDRENTNSAQRVLVPVKNIISELDDENLSIEYEILECRCLTKLEDVDKAREMYANLSKRYPRDSRPLLYLAEIYLNDKDWDTNRDLLEKAEKIDSDFWLLKLEHLVRKLSLGEKIDTKNVDEEGFTDNPKIKASFYRLYALIFEDSGDQTNADRFIENAIHLVSDRFSNYLDKITIIEMRMIRSDDISERFRMSQVLLDEIDEVERKFSEYGDIGPRNKANLHVHRLNALLQQDNVVELVSVSEKIFRSVINCYFDRRIGQIIARVFRLISLPDPEFNRLLDYLRNSKNEIGDELSGVLIFQFNLRGTLFDEGKGFFSEIQNEKYLDFISDLEEENIERVLEFLEKDVSLAIAIASTPNSSSQLSKKIIENLPDEKDIQKDKLKLLLNFEEKDFDKAFEILKQLDLTNLDYFECRPMLQIARQKGAWDFQIIILEKLLEKEKNETEIFNLKFELLYAYLNLKKFPEVIDIGERLLDEDSTKNLLDQGGKEGLLANTLIACLERGKVDSEALKKGREFLEKYPLENPSFEFKAGIEAEIYLSSNEAENALKAVIEGVKIKRILSPQEYAKLYYVFVRLGNQIGDLNIESLNEVRENTFVQLEGKAPWYFIGKENELDALRISKTNNRYSLFIDKKLGDKVVFDNIYGLGPREYVIERIFSIEKYVLWQVVQNFQRLASEGDLEGVIMVSVPPKEDTIDLKNILRFFQDLEAPKEPLFDLYCKNNIPLAMLAISEGGLTNAVGRIQQEGKGYIHFSLGSMEELEKQKEIAKRITDKKLPFYIDGTSALFLSESGMLPKIYKHMPNLKVPQSVISFLANTADRFRFEPGQTDHHMGYARGQIIFSSIDKDRRDLMRSRFISSIKLLESTPESIGIISSANKIDCLSESRTPAELSDACILAQKEDIPVLTEDLLYLKLNETETKKKAPEYFSSLVLLRALYEKQQISFDEYLEYFGYLSSYRFRFLNLTTDDIEIAVFGDGEIKTVKPENIRKLNFPLTLSEEYGVSFQTAFRVVGLFLIQVLIDSAVTVEIAEKLFVEILSSFPTDMGKKELGQLLLRVCIRAVENTKSKSVVHIDDQMLYKKVDKLFQLTEIYSSRSKLYTLQDWLE